MCPQGLEIQYDGIKKIITFKYEIFCQNYFCKFYIFCLPKTDYMLRDRRGQLILQNTQHSIIENYNVQQNNSPYSTNIDIFTWNLTGCMLGTPLPALISYNAREHWISWSSETVTKLPFRALKSSFSETRGQNLSKSALSSENVFFKPNEMAIHGKK